MEIQHIEGNAANIIYKGDVVARIFDFNTYVLYKVLVDGHEGQVKNMDEALQLIKSRLER